LVRSTFNIIDYLWKEIYKTASLQEGIFDFPGLPGIPFMQLDFYTDWKPF
jgi:hypothetical protein